MMSRTHFPRLILVALSLAYWTSSAYAQLASTTTAVSLSFTKGGSLPTAATAIITASTSTTFTVDPTTVPVWLSVTPTGTVPYSVDSSGNSISFAGTSLVALSALTIGNYTTNVNFYAAGSTTPLPITVTLSVSNSSATLGLLEGASATTLQKIWNQGTARPTPVVTPISSAEPISFTASCQVVSVSVPAYGGTNPCTLHMGSTTATGINSLSGVAYDWGTPLTTTFDDTLFVGTPIGTTVTLTVTVIAGSTLTFSYEYTVQPSDPALQTLSPTSIKPIATVGTSVLLTLTGQNFVSPGQIINGLVSPTQVFVGASAKNYTANAVILSPTVMQLTLLQSDIPPLVGSAKSATLAIGVANQTGTAKPTVPLKTATVNLGITTSPVIYAITSTATYHQPTPGAPGYPLQQLAPYELVSIFGDNFNATTNVAGSLDPTYFKYGTSANISGAGTTASPYVTLSVTFKSTATGSAAISAPVLFANGTQINVIVPSGLPIANNANVQVTSGAASSDNFPVGIIAADPGIFTLNSDGVGPGAILNHDGTINQTANGEAGGNFISIYMTGLGAPDSSADDLAPGTSGACVAITDSTKGHPGYMEVVNTSNPTATPPYVAPKTAWKNIDGAVFQSSMLVGNLIAPCFSSAPKVAASVTFGTAPNAQTVPALFAGFAVGSVAGLYQVNVTVPTGLTSGPVPVVVTLGTEGSSPVGVTMTAQ